jgi:hypothetical protein
LDLEASLILPNLISQQNDSANEEAILNWSLITTMKPLEIPTPYDQKIWLHAHPSTSLGTLLDNQSFRISICLRLGIPICIYVPHPCTCTCEIVDKLGLHGLSCYRNAGRKTRHEMINDLVKRAQKSAEIPSIREPNGYYRKDQTVTLIPWLCGKPLLWDVTCTDTLVQSYIRLFSKKKQEKSKYVTAETNNIIITILYLLLLRLSVLGVMMQKKNSL